MAREYSSGSESEIIDEKRYKKVQTQKKVLFAVLLCTLVGLILFLIALCTIHWVKVEVIRKQFTVTIWLGVWGEWRRDVNETDSNDIWIGHFPEPPDAAHRLSDFDLPHYYRAQAAFSVIALALKIGGIAVGFYSTNHLRYVYKRLAAGLFMLASLCVIVVIQVLVQAIEEWEGLREDEVSAYSDASDEYDDKLSYEFSIILAYIDFAIFVIAAISFACCSGKHKGEHAATGEYEFEDRPMNLGR